MTTGKNLERRLRRALNMDGYVLHKSRRALLPNNMGGYMIADLRGNYVVAGSCFELSLDDVQAWLED